MKRTIMMLLLVMCSFVMVYAGEARLVSVSGTVEVREPGGEWTPVSGGELVSGRSMISTGFGSRAKVELGGMTLNLQPLTRVVIDSLGEEKDVASTQVSLQTGRVRASRPPATRATRRSINFKVSTPMATAAVRGTDFELGANGRLTTHEGLVAFSQGDAVVFSPAGTTSSASAASSAPVQPSDLANDIWSISSIAWELHADDEFGSGSGGSDAQGSVRITLQ